MENEWKGEVRIRISDNIDWWWNRVRPDRGKESGDQFKRIVMCSLMNEKWCGVGVWNGIATVTVTVMMMMVMIMMMMVITMRVGHESLCTCVGAWSREREKKRSLGGGTLFSAGFTGRRRKLLLVPPVTEYMCVCLWFRSVQMVIRRSCQMRAINLLSFSELTCKWAMQSILCETNHQFDGRNWQLALLDHQEKE